MHCSRAEDITLGNTIGTQTRHRLSNEEGIAFLHALTQVSQKLLGTAARIPIKRHRADPHLTVADRQREHGNIVTALGKAASRGQVKAPMVPMTAQDTILNRPL